MSYCRFENTYNDLKDCFDNLAADLSKREFGFRQKLKALCDRISQEEWIDTEEYQEPKDEDEDEDWNYEPTFRWWATDEDNNCLKQLDDEDKQPIYDLIQQGIKTGQFNAFFDKKVYTGWWERT